MKKYIAPKLKVLTFDAEDIIQTSSVVESSVPKTVVNGTATQATNYGATNFSQAYGPAENILD